MAPSSSKSQDSSPRNFIKYLSLIVLTVQNAALGISMRYARTRNGDMFSPAAAVLLSEFVKLIVCLGLVILESGNIKHGLKAVKVTVFDHPMDTLKISVPSVLYIIQNNLLYVSASHLDAATYQVTYQLKILTTAFFAVVILKRVLRKWQWIALGLLAVGVAMVQLANDSSASVVHTGPAQSRLLGFSAALVATMLSGFAGIYFEKMLKGSDISVWMRNVQLSLLSLPFGLITYILGGNKLDNIFFGFNAFVWYLVVLQAGGGLLVAVVVKYADNILKGFATSLAIVISCIVSIYFFDFSLTLQFATGTMMVMCSVFLYSYEPKKVDIASLKV